MTRKKWNRLRRQRPELFRLWYPWEKLSDYMLDRLRRYSPSELIAEATAYRFRGSHIENMPESIGSVDQVPTPSLLERGWMVPLRTTPKRVLIHNLANAPMPYLPNDLYPEVNNSGGPVNK